MACRSTERSYGYESRRFEKDVEEDFHCSICYNVLKEPRTCGNNDHMFCLDCITEHLTVNSQACPECNEHLSVDTLRRPRVVNNYLSKLKIKCDYADRGCPEFVRLADLNIHVENCGFAPVLCSNEECGMEINKQDKVHHETDVCVYNKVKSSDFRQIQVAVERLERNLNELNGKVKIIKEDQQRVKDEVDTVKEKMEAIQEDQEEAKKEVQDVKKEVNGVKQQVKDVQQIISKLNKDANEVKVMMIQMLEKINMLEPLNKLPSSSEGMMNTPRKDILIANGRGLSMNVQQSTQSTEIYSWEKNGWFGMPEMNENHAGASSFIHKDQLYVVGGYLSKTIEILDLNELPLKWMNFPEELPYTCDNHQTVVYQERIIHVGGYNSNVISELELSSPCTMTELCEMPESRGCHGAVIYQDKVMIMGGIEEPGCVLDSVLKFDVTENEYTEMPPLPRALLDMATVRWRDKVVVLGGQNGNYDILNDVFMYDYETGRITPLPSMLEKRCACCAVITGNTIVVMGGMSEKRKALKSVECFTMGGSRWEYLPDMNVARWAAIAEVLPSSRKYV